MGETAMSQYYDGFGRMRDRERSVLHGLRTIGIVLKVIALFGFIVTYPLWGRLIPTKAI